MASRERDRSRQEEKIAAQSDRPARSSAVRPASAPCEIFRMTRAQKSRPRRVGNAGVAPRDLYDYAWRPRRAPGRPSRCDPATWIVTDDWPESAPVTSDEVDVFEAWFGDLLDEIFQGRR